MKRQETDQKAVVLGAAVVIVLFIAGFVLVAAMNNKGKETGQSESTIQQPSTTTQPTIPTTPTTTSVTSATETRPTTAPASTPVTGTSPPASTVPLVEKELTFPPTVAQIKAFFPDGITTVRYWYEDMDDQAGYEVAVAYAAESQVHLAILTGTEPLYHVLWDEELPGRSAASLDVGDRNHDDITEIAVVTSQGGGSGYMNLVQFSATGPVVLLLQGGEHDGQNTKISFSTTAAALSTTQVYRVDLGDLNANGKDEINILSGPAVGDTSGEFQVYQDTYEWDGEQYAFTTQSLITPADTEV